MKKKNPISYDYIVHNISKDNVPAYKAVIPAFSAIVYGDTLDELESGIRLAIEEETITRKKRKRTLPNRDAHASYSGKFVVRLHPSSHERLALEAKARGKSLNAYVQEKLSV